MNEHDRPFTLNRHRKMIGGVCAGIGDYFDIPTFWVRLLFVFAMFTWGPTLLAYVALYLIMNKQRLSPKSFADDLNSTYLARKIRSFDYKKSMYKNKQRGKLYGVCYGVGQYLGISPLFVRLGFAVSLLFGPFAIALYIILVFVLDDESKAKQISGKWHDLESSNAERRINSGGWFGITRHQRHRQLREYNTKDIKNIAEVFEGLETKLRRIEATVTSSKFRLHSEFKRM